MRSRSFRSSVGEIVGPSFQGWLPRERFRAVSTDGVQRVAGKNALVASLKSACSPEEWEHGAIDADGSEIWASTEGGEVVALGQLRVRSDETVDPGVITHPAYRGQGHGLRLVSAMAQDSIEKGRLMLYQTLLSNAPAVSLALRLGFEQYASLLAVRLAQD